MEELPLVDYVKSKTISKTKIMRVRKLYRYYVGLMVTFRVRRQKDVVLDRKKAEMCSVSV